jgi:ferrochelatase
MTTGVVLLNFGEPAEPDREAVVEYLRRIFLANARLESADTEAEREARARELAERRAPGLLGEYEAIGGSPLAAQAEAQADALEAELRDRGFDATTYVGMQFTEPTIGDAAERAREDGVDELVGLPVYPLCGPSTTVQALQDLADAADDLDWDVPRSELTGWHRHPAYNRLRAENVAAFAGEAGVDLDADGTRLVFSAHGTPKHYIEEGSRYDRYVAEYCDGQAALLGVDDYDLGFQNHENRDIPWTEPEVEDVVADTDADRVVVEPVSFVHEQSETLSELDVELREVAEDAGVGFHRVPVPHDDGRLPSLFADLIEPLIAGFDPGYYNLGPCRCREGAVCLNASGPTGRRRRAATGAAGDPEAGGPAVGGGTGTR